MAASIPKIRLSIVSGELGKVSDPNSVSIVRTEAEKGINEVVISLVHSIAKDYVFQLGEEFRNQAQARINFSVERGVVFEACSDPRLEECYSQHAILLPKTEVKGPVWLIEPTPDMLEEPLPNSRADEVLVDVASMILQKQGLEAPQSVELEIVPFIPLTKGKGLTTSNLRYPHLLLDLLNRLEKGLLPADSSVCIVGPGLIDYEDSNVFPTCPQFAELLGMIPKGKFTLLDIDKDSLTRLSKQIANNFTAYDLMGFRTYTFRKGVGEFVESPEYQKLFRVMGKHFAQLALAPSNAEEIIQGNAPIQPLVLRVQQNQLALRVFDITKSFFKQTDQFDVMVATMSIVNAFQDEMTEKPHLNHFGKLIKFLEALKVGGTLYIDAVMIQHLFSVGGQEGFDLGIKYLESVIGNRLQLEEIPYSSFKEGASGMVNTITAASMNFPKGIDRNVYLTTTSDLFAITRTSEKVDPKEKGPIALKLLELLKDMQSSSGKSE